MKKNVLARRGIRRIQSLMLCLVMCLTMIMPPKNAAYAAEGELPNISEIHATIAVDKVAVYGNRMRDPGWEIISGKPSIINTSIGEGGHWQKYNYETKQWQKYKLFGTEYYFEEGTWRYVVPVTVNTNEAVFDPSIEIYVNDVKWEHGTVQTFNNNACWYTLIYSPSITIEAPPELNFINSGMYEIKEQRAGDAIKSFSVSGAVSGGTAPYTFSKTEGPEWINVSANGEISGTPATYGENQDLVVRVTDSADEYKEITILVARTIKGIEDLDHINSVSINTNIDDLLVEGNKVAKPTLSIDNIEPAIEYKISLNFDMWIVGEICWQKKEGNAWVKVGNDKAFEKGIYRFYGLGIVGNYDEVIFDNSCKVFFDGEECTIQAKNSLVNGFHHAVFIISPEYCIHDFVDKECTICHIKECVVLGNHDFSKYTSNGDGTHNVACENCGVAQEGYEADACVAGSDGICAKCGAITAGWQKIDGKWKFYKDGVAQIGWIKDGGKWYYLDTNGNMKTGWVKDGGKWYYMASSGAMSTGWKQIKDVWYYFGTNGVMVTGWQKISNKWYYFEDGAMVTGWKKISNKWYYFADGVMVEGWKKLDGKWYYFDGGAMTTGWKKLDNKWYYFGTSGVMTTGWKQIDSKWYYFGTDGVMVSNKTITVDGKKYTFNASGVWVK